MSNTRNNKTPAMTKNDKSQPDLTQSCKDLSDVLLNHIGLRLMIEQKVEDASKQVGREFKWYAGLIIAAITIFGFFGIKPLAEWYKKYAEEKVTEKYVSTAVQNQLNQFCSSKVQPLLDDRIYNAKTEINTLFDGKMTALNDKAQQIERQTQIVNEKFELVKTLLSASSGRRKDYDRLRDTSKGTNELAQIAQDSLAQLNETYENRKRLMSDFNRLTLSNNKNGKPKKLHSDVLIDVIHSDLAQNCEGAINDLANKMKTNAVPTLLFAMRNTKYLNCMFAAIRGIEKITGEQFPALGTDNVEAWWEIHCNENNYQSALEDFKSMKPLPGETEAQFLWRAVNTLDKDLLANPQHSCTAEHMLHLLMKLTAFDPEVTKCKEPFERSLNSLSSDDTSKNMIFAYRAVYYYKFKSREEFIAHVNKRLKEHPDFERELKLLNYFNNTFFSDYDTFNWPSHSAHTSPAQK